MRRFLFGVVICIVAYQWWTGGRDVPELDTANIKAKTEIIVETATDWVLARFGNMVDITAAVINRIPRDDSNTGPGQAGPGADLDMRITRVVDGDTIDVDIDGRPETIRYIGANTPERDEPCYQDATRANRELLQGGPLRLDTDETDTDTHGRLLRYVYAGDTLVERELIRQGWAEAVKYRSDDKHYNEFRKLERQAKAQGLGCHPTGIFADGNDAR